MNETQKKPLLSGGESREKYLSFQIDKELYALSIDRIREVMEYRELTGLPQMPEFFRGVIHIRGKVVPVIDLKQKFLIGRTETTMETGIIVTENVKDSREILIGLMTDQVHEVIEIPQEEIEPCPYTGTAIDTSFISGMGRHREGFLTILNLDTILNLNALEFSEIEGTA